MVLKLHLIFICGIGLLVPGGCLSPEDHKARADETVYQIIDQKWKSDYGDKSNYRVGDVLADPNDLFVEKIIPADGIMTLRQAVQIATAYNRQYQLEKELLYTTALDLRLARHVFEPQPFGGAAGGYTKVGDEEAVSAQSNLGFNQLLASGAAISTNVTLAWVDVLTGQSEGGLRGIWDTTITQPLLRGSDSDIVLENLTQAERNTVYQIRLFNRFRQTLVVSVVSQYYRVLEQWELLKNAQNNIAVLTEIGRQMEPLVNAGLLGNYELDRVHQDLIAAQDLRINIEKDYRELLDTFKVLLSLPPTAEFGLDENELASVIINESDAANKILHLRRQQEAVTDISTEAVAMLEGELDLIGTAQKPQDRATFTEAEAVETALLLRLDLANRYDAIADAQRKIRVTADALRAGLNLTGNTSLSTDGSSDSLINVGAQLDLPLDRTFEANEYRKALLTLSQRTREYEEAADTVALEVRLAWRDLMEAADRYRLQAEAMELAQKRYQNTMTLMRLGQVSSRRVLDAQEALFESQNTAVEKLADYAVATLEFYRDTGVLQVRPDGMWE